MKLSPFDEKDVYGERFTLVAANNESLLLRNASGQVKPYVDMMSAYGSCNFGHCNPNIRPFQHYPADVAACFYPDEAYTYTEWLTERLALPQHAVLFQVGGSAAVSAALSMAQRIRKGKVAHLSGSFHGLGLDALSITDTHKSFALQDTELLRGMQGNALQVPVNSRPEHVDWKQVSCFIFEPIQGANGYIPLESDWLLSMIESARAEGVVIIADEIQSGYYRHGHLSIAQHLGLQPDILLFSKSMTNGLFPFSAVVYPQWYADRIQGKIYLAHTFQTSALGCYAAKAVADYIDNHDVASIAAGVQNELTLLLRDLEQINGIIRPFLTGPTLSFELEGRSGKELVQQCLSKGVLIFTGGPNGERVRIAPPITIDIQTLRSALHTVREAVGGFLALTV